jgi:hypothetical protein
MIGRLIERLFVQVRADLSQMSQELQDGVRQTRAATGQMAAQWSTVETSIQSLTRQFQRGKVTQADYMRQLNQHVKAMSQVGMEYREAQRQVHGYAGALAKAARAQAVVHNTAPIQRFNRSLGQSRMQMMNLGYQLNDIGMTLATGMNPMTVLIQQGSQILQIYAGQGGVSAALGDISKMLVGIGKRLWPIAVLAAGFGILQREINKTSDVSVTFGDTLKAVFQVVGRKIMDLVGGPLGWLQERFGQVLDFIAEWFPKIMNFIIGAMVSTVKTIGALWDALPDLFSDAFGTIRNKAIDLVEWLGMLFLVTIPENVLAGVNKIVQSFVFAFRAIRGIWEAFPDIMRIAIASAVNWVVDGVENMIDGAINGINKLIEGINSLLSFVGAEKALELFGFSGQLGDLDPSDLGRFRMDASGQIGDVMAEIGRSSATAFNENFVSGVSLPSAPNLEAWRVEVENSFGQLGDTIAGIFAENMNRDWAGDFFDEVRTQAIENAMNRIANGLEGENGVAGAAQRAAEEVQTLMETLDEGLTTAADNLAAVFGSAFERLAETGRFTFSDFIQDLNQLIIKSTSELLQEELSNMFKTLATSKGGLGSLFSNLFTGLFGGGNMAKVGARARGGVEMPWRNFIAGEEGAELISQDGPAGARRVATAGRTRHMMGRGGGGTQVNMYITTPDVESFQKSQGQIASRMNGFLARGQRNQ